MTYKILFAHKAKKDFLSLDAKIQKRIAEKLRFFIKSKQPLRHAKKLTNPRLGFYRFRVGDYRIIFDINDKGRICLLYILKIKHRKEVYE